MTEPPRWQAVVHYRSETGLVDVAHDIEEIADLHDLIERGPDWRAIDRIEFRLIRTDEPGLTIEQSAR